MHHLHELSLEYLNVREVRVELEHIESLFAPAFYHNLGQLLIIF